MMKNIKNKSSNLAGQGHRFDKKPTVVLVVLTFAFIAAVPFLYNAWAVTPTASIEPESSTISGQVGVVNDATASTNRAVQFGQSDIVYDLIFADEFNGSSIDTSKWLTLYPWTEWGYGGTNTFTGEGEWYLSSQATVTNGYVNLKAIKQTYAAPNGNTYPYVSGLINTGGPTGQANQKFSFTYGYIEMRCKIPVMPGSYWNVNGGNKLWPAFWLMPVDHTTIPELDIFEFFGSSTQPSSTLHLANAGLDSGTRLFNTEYGGQWVTWGYDWQPGNIKLYVNGVEKWSVANSGIPNKPYFIIANLAVSGAGKWGLPGAETPPEADFQIDYVRVYKNKPIN